MDYQKYRNVPNRLRMYRRLLGLTQKEVGEQLGIDPDWLSRWESGIVLPNLVSALHLSRLYRTTVDELFDELK